MVHPDVDSAKYFDNYRGLPAFKEKLLEIVSAGDTEEMRLFLGGAPTLEKYKNHKEFIFGMYQDGVRVTREDVSLTILSLAVNVGNYHNVRAIMFYLETYEIERGYVSKALNAPYLNNKSGRQMVRRISPLQSACSIGLYKIVEVLLSEGADPNGLDGQPSWDDANGESDFIYDDWETPLMIVLNSKLHNVYAQAPGLTYRKVHDPVKDVDYVQCLAKLLDRGADPLLRGRLQGGLPIFRAIKNSPDMLRVFLEKNAAIGLEHL